MRGLAQLLTRARAHGGGAVVRPSGVWSYGGEGTYATADTGTTASGGVGSFG